MTTLTQLTPAERLKQDVLEPATRELDSIRRELRGIDPSNGAETQAVAERFHAWNLWGEVEVCLTEAAGEEKAQKVLGASLDYADGHFAFTCAILGLPRMIEPAPEYPTEILAEAIGTWWQAERAKILGHVSQMLG